MNRRKHPEPMHVVAVHSSPEHHFSKETSEKIELIEGHGVRGDAHAGVTVKHRSRVAKDPTQPNLRQVHLIQEELLGDLDSAGFSVAPGQLGENITTRGVDLLGLSAGTRLSLGDEALIEVTGLRNPCAQIEKFQAGLLAAVLGRTDDGKLIRKSGVMAVVFKGGFIGPGDTVRIAQVPDYAAPLEPV